jgi:23S rRNA (uracil1939-C5)-methyltransferase
MNVMQLCPVIERCGGCPLLLQTVAEERATKSSMLTRMLSEFDTTAPPAQLVVGQQRIGYRNRIRLRIDESGRVGFFNSEKSPECAILLPALRRFVVELSDWSEVHGELLIPYAHLEARAQDQEGYAGLYLTRKNSAAVTTSALPELRAYFENLRVGVGADADMPEQRYPVDGSTYQRVPLNGFVQVNFEVNRLLTEHIVAGARARSLHSFADLYCGSGNFALPLTRTGLIGFGVERVAACRTSATRAARDQRLTGVQFIDGDSIETCRHWQEKDQQFDVVIIDPPRAGIRDGFDAVTAIARRAIAYCSCNLASLAKDLRVLLKAGWRLDQLTAFDMFPGTVHVETVAWLLK